MYRCDIALLKEYRSFLQDVVYDTYLLLCMCIIVLCRIHLSYATKGRTMFSVRNVILIGLVVTFQPSVHWNPTKAERFAMELALCQQAHAAPSKCSLYGKIQFVESFPDVKVQVVTSFPDIKVQKVSSFPNAAGKWQIVESSPDYKVQIVESFPDYKIQYVSSFPGCN